MAVRSRRGSTLASSMATASLTRQRTELHAQARANAPRYPTGKRKVTRPAKSSEPREKKQRRPRRWAPPNWDGVAWTARSVHPAGLETHHEPNMSAFFTTAVPPSKLSWLKPRNQVSIWEHLAEVQRRADSAYSSSNAAVGGESSESVPGKGVESCACFSRMGEGTALSLHHLQPPPGVIPGKQLLNRPAAHDCVDLTGEVPDRGAAAERLGGKVLSVPPSPVLLCGVPATEVDQQLLVPWGVSSLKTPAATCPANRVSIMSLVS
jgi:hypothetical protein